VSKLTKTLSKRLTADLLIFISFAITHKIMIIPGGLSC
jgi:hypothetical protein